MTTIILAAEEGGGGYNPFTPAFGLYVWTLIAFIIVFYVLAKKVFPKLQEGLADREQRIKEEIEQAEATRAEAEQILEEYKARVAQAREESNSIIDEARQAAETVRRELISKAEADARSVVEKAQEQLSGERERAFGELQQQLAVWSTQIAERIVEKELSPDAHRSLVDSFIKNIESNGAGSTAGSQQS